jgi:hypothetical protein
MNISLVNEAFGLFIETLPLENMDSAHPKFEELYEKECRIYTLFRQMNEEELVEYRRRLMKFNGDLV